MQSTGLNALVALVAAPPAQANGASANATDDGSGNTGQQFSQLLSDSGKQSDGQQTWQQAATAKMLQSSAAAALSAQEVLTPAEQIAQMLAQQKQVVSPDDAATLIKHIDAMVAQNASNASTSTADTQALAQIKQQLQDIVTTGAPKSIGDILAGAPAIKDAKISIAGLTALLGNSTKKITAPTDNDQIDATAQEETPAVATQAVPVQVFRPDAGQVAAAAAATQSDTQKETVKKDGTVKLGDAVKSTAAKTAATKTTPVKSDADTHSDMTADASDAANNAAASGLVTLMIPLAGSFTQPVTTPPVSNYSTDQSTISITDTMPPSALKPRSDIDQLIPPLNQSVGGEDDDALPEVTLPKAQVTADDAKTTGADALSAISTSAGADAAKDAKQALTTQSDLSAINNLTQTPGATPTQTVGAVQSVSVVQTPGTINHAPITDQVSVGVTKAAKDGIDHITIQLDPAGMGRVEVNMHTNHDGQTQITFTVDKADTFDNLSRDARSLERSLQDAGIKADTGSMQFNMRQQQQQTPMHSSMNNGGQNQSQQQASAQEDATKTSTVSVASISPVITRNYLINVREGVDISA